MSRKTAIIMTLLLVVASVSFADEVEVVASADSEAVVEAKRATVMTQGKGNIPRNI